MINMKQTQASQRHSCHHSFVISTRKQLASHKFSRCHIDSIKLTIAAICTTDEHEILIENSDKDHQQLPARSNLKAAKQMMTHSIECIICWHWDNKDNSVLKKI